MSLESELAKSFDADVIDRYARRFVQMIAGHLPAFDAPVRALELACGTGYATLPILEVLPPGSTLVGVSEDRFALKRMHEKLDPVLRERVFVRKDNLQRLPFAPKTIDFLWACFPVHVPDPLPPVLRAALRALRPHGQVRLAVPVHGSFIELIRAVGERMPDADTTLPRLLAETEQLISAEGWVRLLTGCGAIEVEVKRTTFVVEIGVPASADRLIARHLVGLWLGNFTHKQVDAWLDQAIRAPLTTTVQLALISARRGNDPG